MSKSQRTKGAAGERELCAELAKLFPGQDPPKRTLGQARDGGYDVELGQLRIEVKRRKTFKTLYDWMKQVLFAIAPPGKTLSEVVVPVVMCRADNEEWLATIRLQDIHLFAREVNDLSGVNVEALI